MTRCDVSTTPHPRSLVAPFPFLPPCFEGRQLGHRGGASPNRSPGSSEDDMQPGTAARKMRGGGRGRRKSHGDLECHQPNEALCCPLDLAHSIRATPPIRKEIPLTALHTANDARPDSGRRRSLVLNQSTRVQRMLCPANTYIRTAFFWDLISRVPVLGTESMRYRTACPTNTPVQTTFFEFRVNPNPNTLIKTEYWDRAGGGGNISYDW